MFFRFWNLLFNYLLPPRCLSCDNLTADHLGFCHRCWIKLSFIAKPYCLVCGSKFSIQICNDVLCGRCISKPPSYDFARSLLEFNDHSKILVHAFKYYDRTVFASVFAQMIFARYKAEIEQVDCIVPVPMHKFKRILRYYNQAYLLAVEIAKISGKQLLPKVLIKSKWTKSQTYLTKKQREKNLSHSILADNAYDISGKYIMLVDDVLTTGATAQNCSTVLKKAGASKILLVTIASTTSK